MNPSLKLIIGLGNPGKEYQNTYHNVGHLFVGYLEEHPLAGIKSLRSDVFMNLSGNFVLRALKHNNAEPDELLIAHDDSDLPIGKYKIDYGRGSAGQKGVEDIQNALKTKDFWRLRIGIRPPQEKIRQKAGAFVLKKISSANKEVFVKLFEEITKKLKV